MCVLLFHGALIPAPSQVTCHARENGKTKQRTQRSIEPTRRAERRWLLDRKVDQMGNSTRYASHSTHTHTAFSASDSIWIVLVLCWRPSSLTPHALTAITMDKIRPGNGPEDDYLVPVSGDSHAVFHRLRVPWLKWSALLLKWVSGAFYARNHTRFTSNPPHVSVCVRALEKRASNNVQSIVRINWA